MSNIIDLCGLAGGNTGGVACDPRRANFKTVVIGNMVFDAADYASSTAFKTAMIAATKLATGDSGKAFPFPEIVGVAENTPANKVATLGNGLEITISEGRPSYTIDFLIGTNQEKALRKWNGQIVPVMSFDDSGKFWGTLDTDGNFTGTLAHIFIKGTGFGDYNNAKVAQATITFVSASDFYDFAAFAQTDFNINDLNGLLNVQLKYVSNTTNAFHISAKFINAQLGGDQNLYTQYSADLVAGLWKLTNMTTGVAITLTSVAPQASPKDFLVTVDSTMYTALASGTIIKFDWVSPTTLDAADVVGVEAVPLYFTKP